MRKIAVMLVLSLLFVSALQCVSFAEDFGAAGAVGTIEKYVPLPGGGYEKTTETTIHPSSTGAKVGAGAGAVAGATIRSVIPGVGTVIGAGIGAIAGGIAGWIYGPAD